MNNFQLQTNSWYDKIKFILKLEIFTQFNLKLQLLEQNNKQLAKLHHVELQTT